MMPRTEGISRRAATAKTPNSSCDCPPPKLTAASRAMPTASPISVKSWGSWPMSASRERVRTTSSIVRSKARSIPGKASLNSMSAYPRKVSATRRDFSRWARFSCSP